VITINIFAKRDWTHPKSLMDHASVGREAVQLEHGDGERGDRAFMDRLAGCASPATGLATSRL
jgi:hypothetical protein